MTIEKKWADGICLGYKKSGLTYVRDNEGLLFTHLDIFARGKSAVVALAWKGIQRTFVQSSEIYVSTLFENGITGCNAVVPNKVSQVKCVRIRETNNLNMQNKLQI